MSASEFEVDSVKIRVQSYVARVLRVLWIVRLRKNSTEVDPKARFPTGVQFSDVF